jgi:hypothetical protein
MYHQGWLEPYEYGVYAVFITGREITKYTVINVACKYISGQIYVSCNKCLPCYSRDDSTTA